MYIDILCIIGCNLISKELYFSYMYVIDENNKSDEQSRNIFLATFNVNIHLQLLQIIFYMQRVKCSPITSHSFTGTSCTNNELPFWRCCTLVSYDITEILLKVVLNTINQLATLVSVKLGPISVSLDPHIYVLYQIHALNYNYFDVLN